jgi:PST family polysaccharide transporter
LVGFNIINYFVRNIDNVLIGRFLGPTDLGFYNIAYRMLMFPIVTLTIAVNRALLPSYSKHQKDKKLLAKNYLESLSHISLVSGPIMAGLWAIREPLIDVFLGQRWLPVAQIFTWFAPTGYLQTMLSTTGTILIATGKTNLLRQVGLKNAVMITIGFIIGLRFGIIGMAIAFLLSTALASAITMKVVFDFLELRAMQFAGAVWRQTTLSVTMGLVVFFCNDMMADRFSSLSKLLILIPLGATIYSGLVLVFCSDLLNQLRRT